MAVDRLIVSGFKPVDALVVIAGVEALVEMDFDIASAAAPGADRRRASQEPDAAFKAKIPVGQGADGTDIRKRSKGCSARNRALRRWRCDVPG
jgi:hypothetical protein